MTLIWSRRAQANLKVILTYIAKDDPAAARRLVDAIIGSAEITLTKHPMAGRPGRVEGTREWVVHTRYVVVYRIVDGQIQVITVRHTSSRWPRAL